MATVTVEQALRWYPGMDTTAAPGIDLAIKTASSWFGSGPQKNYALCVHKGDVIHVTTDAHHCTPSTVSLMSTSVPDLEAVFPQLPGCTASRSAR